MRRAGGLWPRVLTLDNFLEAFHLAAKGKADRKEVCAYRVRLHETIHEVMEALDAGQYGFGPYGCFMVWDPKPREIHVASFEQRVVHHALNNVIGTALDRSLIHHTYACRKGKGQHAAVRQAATWAKQYPYYLKMDVKKFYDSIPHEVLHRLLRRRFRESKLLRCLEALIASYEVNAGQGLPIGNLTSQYLGNHVLDGMDHWCCEDLRIPAYLRYMDDMLLFSHSLDELKAARVQAIGWLRDKRGLQVKHGGEINRVSNGIPYLGCVIRRDGIRLQAKCASRYRRKQRMLRKMQCQGMLGALEMQRRSDSLLASIVHADTRSFRASVAKIQKLPWGYA